MAMGRPKGPPSRPLNVRVETSDLDKLALIYRVTGKSTADVVRDAIKLYIKLHESQIRDAEWKIAGGVGQRSTGWETMTPEEWGIDQDDEDAR
ncbi:hypothetical protein WS90_21570 [Burkholderia cepacia]|uniref:CopG family transcriptional regulator n=1 Tax=Burkholderia cepacia TaxID=292 RepID=A0A118KFS2_BURCE|nr:hypothetical protein WS90_21570 [Burkholderia cepacia]